ncbi:MAG: stage II sporulation protein R [Clostridia bacterium]|jgi:stage II sporulation protein R|nr:stage II sporulation protein R [Clostridia bacterium]
MKKIGILFLVSFGGIGIIFWVLTFLFPLLPSETATPPLIRLHILANSDTPEDQELKYRVRDEIIKTMHYEFAEAQSIGESRLILLDQLKSLEAQAEKYIAERGYPYQVQADYGIFEFPVRDYGEFTLPAGKYEALRLIIGEGQGANWWCVLFPPLCFVEGEESLCLENDFKKILESSELENKTINIKPSFKIVEIWQRVINKD